MAITFDQEINQMAFIRENDITEANTKFNIPDCSDPFIILDAPHLIKNCRNNLLNYNIHFGSNGQIAKWEHLIKLFRLENANILKEVPKLSIAHFYLTPFSKMRVKLAAQILSKSVSVAIRKYVNLGQLNNQDLDTADFVEKIDGLFDILNSQSPSQCGSKQAITSANLTEKLQLFSNYIAWFSSWKFEKNGKFAQHSSL